MKRNLIASCAEVATVGVDLRVTIVDLVVGAVHGAATIVTMVTIIAATEATTIIEEEAV